MKIVLAGAKGTGKNTLGKAPALLDAWEVQARLNPEWSKKQP